LNELWSLKGVDPNMPPVEVVVPLCFGGNAVSVSMDNPVLLEANALFVEGFVPKMLVPAFPDERDANPPLLAKLANPPDAGAAGCDAELPNVGFGFDPPTEPKAGNAEEVVPVAHGDAFGPEMDDWPKAKEVGWPNTGAAEEAEVPNVLAPNVAPPVLALLDVGELPHGDGFAPSVVVPPKAGVALAGEPNGDVLEVDVPNACAGPDGAEDAGGATFSAELFKVAMPEYVVPCLIDSEYIIHQQQSVPSCVRTHIAGTGPGDSFISSAGMGL
jgi:hypothetical protein